MALERPHLLDYKNYARFYEKQAEQGHGNHHLDEHYIRIPFVLKHIQPTNEVLEIGCQTGGISRFIAPKCKSLSCIDVAPAYIRKAKEVCAEFDNIKFHVMFTEDLPWKEKFNIVVCMEVLEHVIDPQLVLTKIRKALKPDGKLLVTAPIDWPDPLKEHARNYSLQTLKEELESAHFNPTEIWTENNFIFAVTQKMRSSEPERFNAEFFSKHRARAKGHDYQVATTLSTHFHGKTFLEVGCGLGWITWNLQRCGEDAEGFDISRWAVNHAVCPRIWQGDVPDLINEKRRWDVVFASNVLAYLYEKEVSEALRAMKHVTKEYLIIIVQTLENMRKNLGICLNQGRWKPTEQIKTAQQFDAELKKFFHATERRTAKEFSWWKQKVLSENLTIDEELQRKIALSPKSWFRPHSKTTFILKVNVDPEA